ncbi:hypothetical protein BHM03_00047814 [Ensete ventricosum]|nr:hypothetical protein BHM03_00047814 [Ensete ventricosum]
MREGWGECEDQERRDRPEECSVTAAGLVEQAKEEHRGEREREREREREKGGGGVVGAVRRKKQRREDRGCCLTKKGEIASRPKKQRRAVTFDGKEQRRGPAVRRNKQSGERRRDGGWSRLDSVFGTFDRRRWVVFGCLANRKVISARPISEGGEGGWGSEIPFLHPRRAEDVFLRQSLVRPGDRIREIRLVTRLPTDGSEWIDDGGSRDHDKPASATA